MAENDAMRLLSPHVLALCCTALCAAWLLPSPAPADPGVVDEQSLQPIGNIALGAPDFEMPVTSPALPLVDPGDDSPEAAMLRRLEHEGIAGGFDGIIYENRDGDHSRLPMGMFPRLPHLQFSKELSKKKADVGLGGRIILPAIVVGNSSTAIVNGPAPRSQTRLAMTTSHLSAQAFLTYVSNHLYVYPEHRDHDDADLFPVNWPYTLTTQGSSRSDKPFLRALFFALAAMPADTREALRENRLVAPTLQMILRRSLKGIYSREHYMSGSAHPVVFDKGQLAPERMVSLASSLKPDEIPPIVALNVVEESFQPEAGLADMSELLFNTPAAIGRIWRGPEYTKRMVVSAETTKDPNGRDLQFTWVLLQGDPARVRITPQGPGNARAEITIDWHDPFIAGRGKKRITNRVDIGVFAYNGAQDSAPSFISVAFPGHQLREYEARGQTGKRLANVDYDAEARDVYYDPLLFWSAPWSDRMVYAPDGAVASIWRVDADGTTILRDPDHLEDGSPVGYDLTEQKKKRLLSMKAVSAD